MAAIHGESDTGGALFERILFGLVFAVVAALEASGGLDHLLVAGFFSGAALYLLRPSGEGGRQAVDFVVDFLAVGAFAALCDRSGLLWRAPETMEELFRFSPVGAGSATILYIGGVVALTARSRMALRGALFLLPFLFSLIIALGAPPVTQLGRAFFLGLDVPETFAKIAGRTFVLFLLNEAVVVGVPLALGRFLPRQWRPHGILFVSAFIASLTPFVATAVSIFVTPYVPTPIAALVAALAAALAQAGLWGETYLVTQSLAGLLRATPSLSIVVFHDWKTGAEKGAVYGFVFMALLLAAGLVASFPPAASFIAMLGPLGAALIGAAVFPLARTIMESTDSTPPFFARVEEAYLQPANYARGLVAGAATGIALTIDLPVANGANRFLFGALAGALAYAGVDLAFDFVELTRARR
jgi:cyclic beta-1,2-glucan synthetase